MYEERLKIANALDFDDLLIKTVKLLRVSPEVREKYNDRYKYILIDEYQDTNALQADIIFNLFPDGKGLTVVGDDAQAIYGFRSATVRNILDFPARFNPPAQVVTLVWTVEYVGAPGVCVRQGGVMQAQRQLELVLQSPLRPTGACGASFDVSSLRVAVDYQGATIFDQTLSLPFRFEP